MREAAAAAWAVAVEGGGVEVLAVGVFVAAVFVGGAVMVEATPVC